MKILLSKEAARDARNMLALIEAKTATAKDRKTLLNFLDECERQFYTEKWLNSQGYY